MLIEQTLARLRELRLDGMASALEEQQGSPDAAGLSFEDRLGLLLEREATAREDRRLTRLLRQAKLRLPASVEDIDFQAPRGMDKSAILRLAEGRWIQNSEVTLIVGATGSGKTFLACALAHAACRRGFSSRYYRLSRLLEELALARADGSYGKLLARLQKTRLLVLDDYGLQALKDSQRHDLLEVLEDRIGRQATLIASQLPLDHWHDAVGDATLADAILDRLVHGAHRITLKGGSMRRKYAENSASAPNAE